MRYFRLENSSFDSEKIVEQRRKINEQNIKAYRQSVRTSIIVAIVFFVAFIISLATNLWIMKNVTYNGFSVSNFLSKLQMIVFAILVVVFIFRAVNYPIRWKARKQLGSYTCYPTYYYGESVAPFREYYGWTEPCVVTKCYDSSDKRFIKRDVCIFVADGELRISADLKHGFSFREKDLGCYAFKPDEISVNLINENNILITELKSNEVSFRLGRRAKSFIEKDFLKQ